MALASCRVVVEEVSDDVKVGGSPGANMLFTMVRGQGVRTTEDTRR
jgi:hypothetical protein